MAINQNNDPVILAGARTPIGKLMGGLSSIGAGDLGAVAIREAVQRSGIDPQEVDEAIMGLVVQAGAGQAPARQAAYRGGLPATVGATTINKVCGSGLKAVMMAASAIRAGDGKAYLAGGMESMSTAPYLVRGMRGGNKYGDMKLHDSLISDGLWCSFENWMMGEAAEFIADEFEVSRQQMDEFAVMSHQKAIHAIDSGVFKEEIVPVEINLKGKTTIFETDEGPRRDTSLETLNKLSPAFRPDGRVTAGNAPGLNDGAAALVISSRVYAEKIGRQPLARIVSYAQAALEPKWLFAAPAKAMPLALQKAGWSMEDVDLVEVNEAFAAQVLANGRDMQQQGHHWDWEKVNVNGGAVALGHPVGCSGARVLVTLIYALKARGLKRGMAALCLGGGEAVAMAVELED
jgi:acetyl-CoA C-acetyltransferase